MEVLAWWGSYHLTGVMSSTSLYTAHTLESWAMHPFFVMLSPPYLYCFIQSTLSCPCATHLALPLVQNWAIWCPISVPWFDIHDDFSIPLSLRWVLSASLLQNCPALQLLVAMSYFPCQPASFLRTGFASKSSANPVQHLTLNIWMSEWASE